MSTSNPRKHPQQADDVDGPMTPPDFVAVCQASDCGVEEPAPLDASPGDEIECAHCGEAMIVEVRS